MSDDLGNVSMSVQMNQFDRPTEQVDANLQFSDLSAEPAIESEPVAAQVRERERERERGREKER